MDKVKQKRKYYFDNGKALASFLGIIFHSSLVFTSTGWIIGVTENQFIPSLAIYTDYINLFRMPLFLFISGYFAAYSVKKYDFRAFSVNKLTRLGIPLISTFLTFNLLQSLFSKVFYTNNYTLGELLGTILPWSKGFSLSHLWYVYYVFIFSFLIYFLIKKKVSSFSIKNLQIFIYRYIDIFLITFTIGILGIFYMLHKLTGFNHALLSFDYFGAYLPYFIFGVITFNNWSFYSNIFISPTKQRLTVIVVSLISCSLLRYYAGDIIPYLDTILSVIARYLSLILILSLLHKFLNKSNRYLKYMSDSSYVVYLIHQPIIVIVSYFYIKYIEVSSSVLGYLIVLLTSILWIYLTDYLIRKSKVGTFLYTGRIKSNSRVKEKWNSESDLLISESVKR